MFYIISHFCVDRTLVVEKLTQFDTFFLRYWLLGNLNLFTFKLSCLSKILHILTNLLSQRRIQSIAIISCFYLFYLQQWFMFWFFSFICLTCIDTHLGYFELTIWTWFIFETFFVKSFWLSVVNCWCIRICDFIEGEIDIFNIILSFSWITISEEMIELILFLRRMNFLIIFS